jgi:hypothetical protein
MAGRESAAISFCSNKPTDVDCIDWLLSYFPSVAECASHMTYQNEGNLHAGSALLT